MSQTSTFVKKLAANDRPTREAAFEALKKFLSLKQQTQKMSLLEMEKLWKGLYYSMWFCDRPRPQERLAEKLGQLFSSVVPVGAFCSFVEAFWVVMIKEWPNVDQWRVDKYYLLIRRVVRHCFINLQKKEWDEELVANYNKALTKLPLSGDKSVSMALPYHLCDIYVEELEHIMFKDLKEEEDDLEEGDTEAYQELFAKKLAIVGETPILKLLEPFEQLSTSALLKTLREKCKEEVLTDSRLKDWGVIGSDSDDEDDEEKKDGEDEDSDDEWNGFA